MNADEKAQVRKLERAAREAAPAIPDGPHATDAELARMRAGDEDSSLDAAYRHVASCSACRLALAQSNVVALEPRRAWTLGVAAAAAVLLAVGVSRFVSPGGGRVVVTQRALAGWMGDHDGGDVAPEDRNVEIRVDARAAAVLLVVCDEAGHVISPALSFPRATGASSARVVVVAPRTFAAHAGPAVGHVVTGSEDAVGAFKGPDACSRADGDAHVERITIGAN